ncbi:MAG: glycosyltransferase [Candidatus Wallbacteria bacterium]|nr:glycosyltransferase [Candidatus Wallbacteria bacterium]
MRILMVHPHDIYSPLEPWTVRVTALAERFVKRGHEVKLAYHVLDKNLTLPEARKRQDYAFETIPLIRYNLTLVNKTQQLAELARWSDVVHFQKCLAYAALPALGAAFLAGKPTHYDWDDWEYGIYMYRPLNLLLGKSMNLVERGLPRLVDTVSVASEPLRQMCLSMGVREDHIFEAHVGADLERFKPTNDGSAVRREHGLEGKIVMYLGQLHGAQYLELFLHAAAELKRRRPGQLTFLVVGSGERFGELHALAERLGITDCTVFTGAIPHARVPEYVAAADICVATFEDTAQTRCKSPLKVVEYMAAGKPIVASAMGEVNRMLADCGVLVPCGNWSAVADGVEMYLDDPAMAAENSRRVRQRAERKYNWDVTAENILRAFSLCVGERLVRSLSARPQAAPQESRTVPPPIGTGASPMAAKVPPPPAAKPVLGPVERVKDFVQRNLDLVGVLDGTHAFVGPDTLQIDPTNNCNNDCIACWCHSPLLAEMKMPPEVRLQTIPLANLKKLVDEVASMGTREIYLAGGGEPFMHPNIMEFLAHIKSRGLICSVNTNFTLVNEERVKQMVELGVDHLTVSVWAASPEVFARTHPNKADETFERLKNTLYALYKAKAAANVPKPFIKIYHVLSKVNFMEIQEMIDFTKTVGAESVEFTPLDTMPTKTDYLLLNEGERRWLYEKCLEIEQKRGGAEVTGEPLLYRWDQFVRRISTSDTVIGEHDRNVIETIPCTVGWSFARVLADGNINFCLKAHRIPIGSIYRQSFREVWNSQQQKHYRNKARTYIKDDPFFSMIGNDPAARVGCYRGCDDLGRNMWIADRLGEMNSGKRLILRAAGVAMRMAGREA